MDPVKSDEILLQLLSHEDQLGRLSGSDVVDEWRRLDFKGCRLFASLRHHLLHRLARRVVLADGRLTSIVVDDAGEPLLEIRCGDGTERLLLAELLETAEAMVHGRENGQMSLF